jgi:hypothetical protein
MRWAEHVARREKEEYILVQGFGGKARRKAATRETETEVGG